MTTGTILVLFLMDITILIAIIVIGGMIVDTYQMYPRKKNQLLLMDMCRRWKIQRLGYLG